MKDRKLLILAEIAIFAAIGFALDTLQGGYSRGLFPSGGSIGIAMLPVLIISYRRGLVPGLICGFILSFIQLMTGPYFKNPITILFDYILTYTLVGFAGIFAKSFRKAKTNGGRMTFLFVGGIVGGLLKFTSHLISGFYWLGDGGTSFLGISNNTPLYSLIYNGAYGIPNAIICAIFLVLIYQTMPLIYLVNKISEVKMNEE